MIPQHDWCTHSPDGTWWQCCRVHDRLYADPNATDRAAADLQLRRCMLRKGRPVLAWIYWFGVRLFGGFYWRRDRPVLGKKESA